MSPLGTLNLAAAAAAAGKRETKSVQPSSPPFAPFPIVANTHHQLSPLQFLRLMSVSTLNLSPPSGSIIPQSFIQSAGSAEMLLKSGQLPGGSPVPVPSPSSGSGLPESPKSTATAESTVISNAPNSPSPSLADSSSYGHKKDDEVRVRGSEAHDHDDEDDKKNNNTNKSKNDDDEDNDDNEQDEVLSIGDETTDPMQIDCCDSSTIISEADDECSTTAKSSPRNQNHDESHDDMKISSHRDRKYSSEDSFSIKSLCSPSPTLHSLNREISCSPQLQNNHCNNNINSSSSSSSSNNNNNFSSNTSSTTGTTNGSSNSRSLLFSIANILRPDFGTSPFIPTKSLKSPPIVDFNYRHRSSFAPSSVVTNPIDLSRPATTPNHHHSSLQRISKSHGKPHNQLPLYSSSQNSNNNGIHPHDLVTPPKRHKSSSSSGSGSHQSDAKEKLKSMGLNVLSKGSNHNNNNSNNNSGTGGNKGDGQTLWPAWVYCTRYSDRPSSGPRARRERKNKDKEVDEKRPRTAFTAEQLSRLKKEFEENRYLTEKRRQDLARELRLHENQIKIWFQNKRAKLKKASGTRGGLALQLMAQGLYNHSTIPKGGPEDDDSD